MQLLALSRPVPGTSPERLAELIPAEAHQAWRLHTDGFIRQAYFRTNHDDPGAVLIIEADDVDHAATVLDALPLCQARLITFEIVPIGPFVLWDTLITAPAS